MGPKWVSCVDGDSGGGEQAGWSEDKEAVSECTASFSDECDEVVILGQTMGTPPV